MIDWESTNLRLIRQHWVVRVENLQLAMSDREAVIELVKRLPSNVSIQEIAREIEFVAAVKEGLNQIDRGQGIPIEKVEQMIDSWTTT